MQTVDPAGADWYTPKSQADKPEESRVRFKIRGLVGTEAMDVSFHTEDDGRMSMTSRGGNACLRAGLLGWENLTRPDGTPVYFDGMDWKANVARIPPIDNIDLALEIWNRTFLSAEQKKT